MDHAMQLKRVAEMVDDNCSDEEDSEQRSKPKPGAITPLGVRVDRGQGPLSINGASATIAEMDAAINSIRAWQQRRERDMAEMMRRNETAMEQAAAMQPDSISRDIDSALEGIPCSSGALSEDQSSEGDPVDSMEQSETYCVLPLSGGSPLSSNQTRRRPATASAQSTASDGPRSLGHSASQPESRHAPGNLQPKVHAPTGAGGCLWQRSLGQREMDLLKQSMDLRFAELPGDMPRTSVSASGRLRPASAGPRLLQDTNLMASRGAPAVGSPSRAGLLPPLPSGSSQPSQGAAGGTSSRLRDARIGVVVEEPPWHRRSLSRASSSKSGGSGAGAHAGSLPTCSDDLPDALPMAVTTARFSEQALSCHNGSGRATHSSASSLPVGVSATVLSTFPKTVGPSCQVGFSNLSSSSLRGQQLLDELEAELRALDEDALGTQVSGWYLDYQGVLAKMDRLQSGYQAEAGDQGSDTLESGTKTEWKNKH